MRFCSVAAPAGSHDCVVGVDVRRLWIGLATAVILLGGMGWMVSPDVAASQPIRGMHYAQWDGDITGPVKESLSSSLSSRSSGERWVDVNRSTGQVTLYAGSTAQYIFWGSLSRDTSDGFYATASGTYYVYTKHMPLTYTPYADNYITHWVGFDDYRGNGFHSYTKDASGNVIPNGAGYTAGCVALAPGEIEILYDFAFVGMRVEVHW